MLSFEWENLGLIDLISERYLQLRGISNQLWSETSDISISNSEWLIMARTYKKKPTIASVTKGVDISRQAVHKAIKNLEAKGIVKVSSLETNKKEKCIELTPFGEECFEKRAALKKNLEDAIAEQIGAEKTALLKEILKADWGLDRFEP